MASILDGMIENEEQLARVLTIADRVAGEIFEELKLNDNEVMQLVKEGLSPADIFDISKDQLDALFTHGLQMVQSGELQKARDVFFRLVQLEGTDERFIYALATTYQLEGDFHTAGKLYIQFLALDATNAEGYLRLGECFLSNQEYDHAESMFRTAMKEAQRGNGDDKVVGYAEKMMEHVAQRRAENGGGTAG